MACRLPTYCTSRRFEITLPECGVSLPALQDFPYEKRDLLARVIAVSRTQIISSGECHIYRPEGAKWKEAWGFSVVAFSDGALHIREVAPFVCGGRKRVYLSWLIQGDRVHQTVEIKPNGIFSARDVDQFVEDDALMDSLSIGEGKKYVSPAACRRFQRPTKKLCSALCPITVMSRAKGTLKDLIAVKRAALMKAEITLEEMEAETEDLVTHLIKGFRYLVQFPIIRFDMQLENFLYFNEDGGRVRVVFSDLSTVDGFKYPGKVMINGFRYILDDLRALYLDSGQSVTPNEMQREPRTSSPPVLSRLK